MLIRLSVFAYVFALMSKHLASCVLTLSINKSSHFLDKIIKCYRKSCKNDNNKVCAHIQTSISWCTICRYFYRQKNSINKKTKRQRNMIDVKVNEVEGQTSSSGEQSIKKSVAARWSIIVSRYILGGHCGHHHSSSPHVQTHHECDILSNRA